MNITERIQLLLAEMNRGVYEKETEVSLALLAALSGESILLLGPPGVAKSMIARRLKSAFTEAKAFEYLMSRFSTPDEIFGPVSISRLKYSDKYERVTEGYLPDADVVFLDEIWKAGPAIQNTLLTVINEKVFRNGDREVHLPLKLLVAASNELPTQGEGLEALWDRFMIRVVCKCIDREDAFYEMLLDDRSEEDEQCEHQISHEEYDEWQKQIKQIELGKEVLYCITEIRKGLRGVDVDNADARRNIYISDRRWKKIMCLLKSSAFVHGRTEVALSDIMPLYHCLWNEPDEIAGVRHLVMDAVFSSNAKKISSISISLKADLKVTRVRDSMERDRLRNEHRDDDLLIVDDFLYQIEHHGTGNTYIFVVDFKNLNTWRPSSAQPAPNVGVMYKDPFNPVRTLIRTFSDPEQMVAEHGGERVNLYRDEKHIYINGVRFDMHRLEHGMVQPKMEFKSLPLSHRDFFSELERLSSDIDNRVREVTTNIFISDDDRDAIEKYVATIRKQIAFARVDASKLM